MQVFVIALAIGILVGVVAYVIQGNKSRGNKEPILKSTKPGESEEQPSVTPQQPTEAKENLIPTREWTGGNK